MRPQIGVGSVSISERAKSLVNQVLDSNRLSAGPMMDRFESEIARLHGCRFGLMCNSGTSALQIALGALKETCGWQDGDEVLVPALTFIATSNAVLYNGLKPVFVDVEPDYYGLDPARIERHITSRTRAIMPVHIAGQPCEMDAICEIARRRNLKLIEDSAEAMFVNYRGRPVGSFGEISCFSTYSAHVISTGVGGLCLTSDPDLIVILKSLMNHGRDSIYIHMDDDQGVEGQQLWNIARNRFSFIRLGHSFRATELEAALGLAQVEERPDRFARRRRVVERLFEGLQPFTEYLQLPHCRPGAEHAYMFFPLVVRNAEWRDPLMRHLEEHSVETRYLLPLLNQPVYRRIFGDIESQYPVASHLNRAAFYIGSHPEMTDEDIEWVLDAFRGFFRSL